MYECVHLVHAVPSELVRPFGNQGVYYCASIWSLLAEELLLTSLEDLPWLMLNGLILRCQMVVRRNGSSNSTKLACHNGPMGTFLNLCIVRT